MSTGNKNLSIGVVGNGFVGDAVNNGFLHQDISCKVYDKNPMKTLNTIEEVLDCEFVFVCLPTPMTNESGGHADLSILMDFFNYVVEVDATEAVYIIKSTVPVGTTEMINSLSEKLKVVHNPEFLTAANARSDFLNAERTVIGGEINSCNKVSRMLQETILAGYEEPIIVSSDESELTKYASNCFLALKVSYFNMIHQLCEKRNLDFKNVAEATCSDSRIGFSHSSVPGPDGDFGYGGTCFPKDINAMIKTLWEHDVDSRMLEASWNQNLQVRKKRDWANNPSAVSN